MKAFVVETSCTVYVCTAACALMLIHTCSENLAVYVHTSCLVPNGTYSHILCPEIPVERVECWTLV